jgi:hypothetical protein
MNDVALPQYPEVLVNGNADSSLPDWHDIYIAVLQNILRNDSVGPISPPASLSSSSFHIHASVLWLFQYSVQYHIPSPYSLSPTISPPRAYPFRKVKHTINIRSSLSYDLDLQCQQVGSQRNSIIMPIVVGLSLIGLF